jgi:catechol 2,3-dioxygenase-like lactoylglutathione lyase family enzyme
MPDENVFLMFHPTLMVEDLESARNWFYEKFCRRGVTWSERWQLEKIEPSYVVDYSFFVHLGDVVLDVVAASLYVPNVSSAAVGDSASKHYPPTPDSGLQGIGWYAHDVFAAVSDLKRAGLDSYSQRGDLITSREDVASELASDVHISWTDEERTGSPHELFYLGDAHRAYYSKMGDPRLLSDGYSARLPADDPLGLIRAIRHIFRTADLGRSLRFYRALGGVVTETGRQCVTVEFARSTLTYDYSAQESGGDVYEGIEFAVRDVNRVARHFADMDVRCVQTEKRVTIDPEDGYGMKWIFTELGA